MTRFKIKIGLANILYYTGISYVLFLIFKKKHTIRVVNYHCTPFENIDNFKRQLKFFSKYYQNINFNDLDAFFVNNSKMNKTGIIISFDDGLRSNYDFSLNLLNEFSFTGWFFIPSDFVNNPTLEFAKDNNIHPIQYYNDNRYCMSVEEIKILSKNHIIGSHTKSHHRMLADDSIDILTQEICQSKHELKQIIDSDIMLFCWVGGELTHYTKQAYTMIKDSNYKYAFTTNNLPIDVNTDRLNINRTNIESFYSMPLLLFQLSGILDFFYYFKRLKVKSLFL